MAGRGGVTARALLLTQAGIGAGLAVVTPGPLSPRFFHKHVLFWVEEIRGNGGEGVCEESKVNKAGSMNPPD